MKASKRRRTMVVVGVLAAAAATCAAPAGAVPAPGWTSEQKLDLAGVDGVRIASSGAAVAFGINRSGTGADAVTRTRGGTWSSVWHVPVTVGVTSVAAWTGIDNTGRSLLVWSERVKQGPVTLRWSEHLENGAWTSPGRVPLPGDVVVASGQAFDLAATGRGALAFTRNGRAFVLPFTGTRWGAVAIPVSSAPTGGGRAGGVEVSARDNGWATAVWQWTQPLDSKHRCIWRQRGGTPQPGGPTPAPTSPASSAPTARRSPTASPRPPAATARSSRW